MTRHVRRFLPLLALLALTPTLRAADPPIPADAAAVLTVDVKAVLKSPAAELGQIALDGLKPGEWEAFVKTLPFDPATVTRLTLIAPNGAAVVTPWPRSSPTAMSAVLLVHCSKAFDRDAVFKGYGPNTRRKRHLDTTYQFDDETWTGVMALPGDTTLAVGSEDALVWYIDRLATKPKETPFTAAATAEAAKHALFLAVNPSALGIDRQDLPADLRVLVDAKLGVLAVDTDKGLKAFARLDYGTEAGAKDAAVAVRQVAGIGRDGLKGAVTEVEKFAFKPDPAKAGGLSDATGRTLAALGLGALRKVDRELEALPLEQKGASVEVRYDEIKVPEWAVVPALFVGGSYLSMASARYDFAAVASKPAAEFDAEEKRRKKLFDAFAAYVAKNGQYPPAVIKDKKGQPLYSWRVALLPHLGEEELYKQFKHDEPWDSLHNKKLIHKLPKVFEPSYSYPPNSGKTKVLAVVGPGTLFEPKATVTAADVATPADTVLWVEPSSMNGRYFDGVYWTKPVDAEFDGEKAPDLFDSYEFASLSAMMADGKWRYLSKKDDAKKLPGLFQRAKK